VKKTSAASDKSRNRLHKHRQNLEGEKFNAREDAAVDVSITEVLHLDKAPINRVSNSTHSVTKKEQVNDEDDSDRNSEAEDQEDSLARKKKMKPKDRQIKAFAQRDLVALAFAGDKVVQVNFDNH
jgi:U3 small nucleolar RNA-associated protein 14